MTEQSILQLQSDLRRKQKDNERADIIYGVTGRYDDNGDLIKNPRVPGKTNKLYVTRSDDRSVVECWNLNNAVSQVKSGVPVKIAPTIESNGYWIVGVDEVETDNIYGGGAIAFIQPVIPPELNKQPIGKHQLFELFTTKDASSGLAWRVFPGMIAGKYYGGGVKQVPSLPSAGNAFWTYIGVTETESPSLETTTGTTYTEAQMATDSTALTLLDVTDMIADGILPLAAARVHSNTYSLANVLIQDVRHLFTLGGRGAENQIDKILTDANGDIWVDAQGNVITST